MFSQLALYYYLYSCPSERDTYLAVAVAFQLNFATIQLMHFWIAFPWFIIIVTSPVYCIMIQRKPASVVGGVDMRRPQKMEMI